MQFRVWLSHTLRSAAAACWCTASVMPGASSPTSAAMPPHSRTLSWFRSWQLRVSSLHRLCSAAAAFSCMASDPPGASSPTSAATPPHALTLSLAWVVSPSRDASAAAARSCAAAATPHAALLCVCDAGSPATTLATAAEPPGTGTPTSQPAPLPQRKPSLPKHIRKLGRREQAYQRRSVGRLCRLHAALPPGPEPHSHAAHCAAVLKLERAGAALTISSADAPSLERGARGPRSVGGLMLVVLLHGGMQTGRSTSPDHDKRRRIAHRRALPTEAVCRNQWRCCRTCAPVSGRPRFTGGCCVHPLAYSGFKSSTRLAWRSRWLDINIINAPMNVPLARLRLVTGFKCAQAGEDSWTGSARRSARLSSPCEADLVCTPLAVQVRNTLCPSIHTVVLIQPCYNRSLPPEAPRAAYAAAQHECAHIDSGSSAKGHPPGRAPGRGTCRGTLLASTAGRAPLRALGTQCSP